MVRVITGGNMWPRVVLNGYGWFGYGVVMGGWIEKKERSGRRVRQYHQDLLIY